MVIMVHGERLASDSELASLIVLGFEAAERIRDDGRLIEQTRARMDDGDIVFFVSEENRYRVVCNTEAVSASRLQMAGRLPTRLWLVSQATYTNYPSLQRRVNADVALASTYVLPDGAEEESDFGLDEVVQQSLMHLGVRMHNDKGAKVMRACSRGMFFAGDDELTRINAVSYGPDDDETYLKLMLAPDAGLTISDVAKWSWLLKRCRRLLGV